MAYLKEVNVLYSGEYKVITGYNDYCVYEYLNGKEVKRSNYTSDNILQSQTLLYENKISELIIFDETGNKKFEHFYLNKMLDGPSKIYDENENILITMNFKNSRLHGEKLIFNIDGSIKERHNYKMVLRLNSILLISLFFLFCNTLKAQDNSALIVKHFLIDLGKVRDSVNLKKNLHINDNTSGFGLLEFLKKS